VFFLSHSQDVVGKNLQLGRKTVFEQVGGPAILKIDAKVSVLFIEPEENLFDQRFRTMHGPLLIRDIVMAGGQPFKVIGDFAVQFRGNKPARNTIGEERSARSFDRDGQSFWDGFSKKMINIADVLAK